MNVVSKNYTSNTIEVRASAINFSGKGSVNIKEKKTRSFENTTLFTIARKIANENHLKIKISGEDQNIVSILQNNQSNLEFLYSICFDLESGENAYKMQISQPKMIMRLLKKHKQNSMGFKKVD